MVNDGVTMERGWLFEWWRLNQDEFPRMAAAARDYLPPWYVLYAGVLRTSKLAKAWNMLHLVLFTIGKSGNKTKDQLIDFTREFAGTVQERNPMPHGFKTRAVIFGQDQGLSVIYETM
ncbi:hypothetical protein V1524DRAFT_439163 [Lipomyces starkeyi]